MLYQLWSCAATLSHGLLPCLLQRFTLGTGASRLELLTVILSPDAGCGTEAVETRTYAQCQLWQRWVVFDRQQGRQMDVVKTTAARLTTAHNNGCTKVPARLVSCLWKWVCKMAGTALERALLSVLWAGAQIAWDLHWLVDLGLESPRSWVSLGREQLSEGFASGRIDLTLFPLLMVSGELW